MTLHTLTIFTRGAVNPMILHYTAPERCARAADELRRPLGFDGGPSLRKVSDDFGRVFEVERGDLSWLLCQDLERAAEADREAQKVLAHSQAALQKWATTDPTLQGVGRMMALANGGQGGMLRQ